MQKRPFLLGKSFFPKENKGNKNLEYFRERAYKASNRNLQFLLKSRYEWMSEHIKIDDTGCELGAGIGISKLYLPNIDFDITDCYYHPWIDRVVDAVELPYDNESMDFIIASNMIHHIPYPMKFFKEANRVLKRGGKILINDVNCSLIMRILLRLLKHEGYSYENDVFSEENAVNDPNQAWSGNNAVCDLLFRDNQEFESRTGFRIEFDKSMELFTFLFSGGVSSEFKTIQLPHWTLMLLEKIDNFLCNWPSIFPISRRSLLIKSIEYSDNNTGL